MKINTCHTLLPVACVHYHNNTTYGPLADLISETLEGVRLYFLIHRPELEVVGTNKILLVSL